MKISAITVLVLAIGLSATGCDLLSGLTGSEQVPPPVVAQAPIVPPTQMPVAAIPPVPVPTPVAPVAEPVVLPPYQWTETPTVEGIPQVAAAGMANNVPMAVKSVVIEPSGDKWRMKISDQVLESPTAIQMGGQSVNLDLPGTPAASTQWTRPMTYGDGFFQIGTDPSNPQSTTSWNADNAWAIEFTKWEVAPYDANGDIFQEAGKASGRFAVCYKGSPTGIQSSWVAGTFEDAVVRYMGKPSWLEEGGKAPASDEPKSSSSKSPSASKLPTGTTPPVADKEPEPVKEPEPAKEPAPKDGQKIDVEKAKATLKAGLDYLKKKDGEKAPEGNQ